MKLLICSCGRQIYTSPSAKAICKCGQSHQEQIFPDRKTIADTIATARRLPLRDTDQIEWVGVPHEVAESIRGDGTGRRVFVVGYSVTGRELGELRVKHGRDAVYMAIYASGIGSLVADHCAQVIPVAYAPEWAEMPVMDPEKPRPHREEVRRFARACRSCEHWGSHPCNDGHERHGCGLLSKPCRVEVLHLNPYGQCPIGRFTHGYVDPPVFETEPESPMSSDRCVITVVSGEKAEELHYLTRGSQMDYAERIGADYVVIWGDQCPQFPIGNKWRIGQVARRYERSIFLDVDTIVMPQTPDLFELVRPMQIGIHDDKEFLPNMEWIDHESESVCRSQGMMRLPYTCYNSGVVIFDREHAGIWDPPEKPFPPTHCAEQILVEQAIRRGCWSVVPLQWRFNWQWWMKGFKAKMHAAWIVHLANAPHDKRIRIATQLKKENQECRATLSH